MNSRSREVTPLRTENLNETENRRNDFPSSFNDDNQVTHHDIEEDKRQFEDSSRKIDKSEDRPYEEQSSFKLPTD